MGQPQPLTPQQPTPQQQQLQPQQHGIGQKNITALSHMKILTQLQCLTHWKSTINITNLSHSHQQPTNTSPIKRNITNHRHPQESCRPTTPRNMTLSTTLKFPTGNCRQMNMRRINPTNTCSPNILQHTMKHMAINRPLRNTKRRNTKRRNTKRRNTKRKKNTSTEDRC